ncbi:unnamed protein product, partial [Polarella glacialis]
ALGSIEDSAQAKRKVQRDGSPKALELRRPDGMLRRCSRTEKHRELALLCSEHSPATLKVCNFSARPFCSQETAAAAQLLPLDSWSWATTCWRPGQRMARALGAEGRRRETASLCLNTFARSAT